MSHTIHSVNLGDLGKTRGFPHRGWDCIGVADLNPDNLPSCKVEYGTCQACAKHPIRFVHTLVHDDWADAIKVGRICVEHLTDDYVNPKRRESELRNRSRRRAAARCRWICLQWRTSVNGNLWAKVKGHHVVIFPSRFSEGYGFGIDGKFHRGTFPTQWDAKMASCDRFLELEGERPRRRRFA